MIFTFLQIQTDTSLSELRSILQDIGEDDAATYMGQVLSVKDEAHF